VPPDGGGASDASKIREGHGSMPGRVGRFWASARGVGSPRTNSERVKRLFAGPERTKGGGRDQPLLPRQQSRLAGTNVDFQLKVGNAGDPLIGNGILPPGEASARPREGGPEATPKRKSSGPIIQGLRLPKGEGGGGHQMKRGTKGTQSHPHWEGNRSRVQNGHWAGEGGHARATPPTRGAVFSGGARW